MVKLLVDNKEIETEEGNNVLQACLDNDIYIPNLCYLKEMDNPPGSCRLCFVEIEGYNQPITSCTVKVKEGMEVSTNTEHVRKLQRTAFELLLSIHSVDCKNCPANKKCELQRIAKFLHFGLKLKRLEQLDREEKVEQKHPFLEYVPDRCVLCGKCVFVCKKKNGQPMLSFAKKGFDTVISFFGEEDKARATCEECYACVEICPVAALIIKNNHSQ
ncbi:MAG: (2Fe-2S)-binding protein [Deltaproteobacteria bacterium]|nr:(2Fe-2S)-binding protein [Deltaproteobacteria bacterium]